MPLSYCVGDNAHLTTQFSLFTFIDSSCLCCVSQKQPSIRKSILNDAHLIKEVGSGI